MFNDWELDDGRVVRLITKSELDALPDGTEVIRCIDGEKLIKGKDYLDNDTRFGYLAFGLEIKTQ